MPCRLASVTDVLVVGDANPDLILSGDVVPRFGQVEQLLDGADMVIGGSAGSSPTGWHGWVGRHGCWRPPGPTRSAT